MEQTTEAALIVQETGQVFPLTQEFVTIGRKFGNTVVLVNDPKVSRHHAAITWEADRCLIQDMGSANGTFVNNQRLTKPSPLSNGDVIRVGGSSFTVQLPDADTKPSLTPPPVPGVDTTLMSVPAPALDLSIQQAGLPQAPDNPYVGPRTFTQAESNRFFGREREARELFSLVISERLVLFYAQSGAGKSSLINARLTPQLREAGLAPLPISRVSGELPEGVADVENIFLFNLILSLDESDGDPKRFTHMSLYDFLTRLTSLDGQHYYYDDSADLTADAESEDYQPSPYVLIIDQFEEIFTAHQTRWQEREGFFRQLDQAMADDPMLWVVLTLREDYAALLDPYTHLLPGKMRARFYMQRMEYKAALEAIEKPAEQYGRPFASGVAQHLVDNLRQIRVQGPVLPESRAEASLSQEALGQFVEPVQLQVVCYQLWENLREQPPGQITQQNLEEMGDVDAALAQFYEQALIDVVNQTGVSEIELRNWFETQLITEADTRGTVYRGARQTGGIDNRAVDLLAGKYLLRSETRTGGAWYELVHDRFVEPILRANQEWRLTQPLIQMAQEWADSDRAANKLLEGQPLQEALAAKWQALGTLVKEFLTASQAAQSRKEQALQQKELKQAQALAQEQQKRAEEQLQASASLRKRAWLMAGAGIIAVISAFIAGWSGFEAIQRAQEVGGLATLAANRAEEAQYNASLASANEATAVAAQETAEADKATAAVNAVLAATNAAAAIDAQETAEAEKATAAANALLAATNEAAALEAQDLSEARQKEAEIARQIAEAARVTAVARLGEAEAAATAAQDALAALESSLATRLAEKEATPTPSPTAPPTIPPVIQIGPTNTPTITPTPTPNQTATAEYQAIQEQLDEVRATQTAAATQVASCQIQLQGVLLDFWDKYRERLGCPEQSEPVAGGAEQTFENGYMFWSRSLEEFVVTIGVNEGKWYFITKTDFNPSGAGCDPDIRQPTSPNLIQPVRGFGGIWCENLEIQKAIGYATEKEHDEVDVLLQKFEGGVILRDSQKQVYILFWGDGTYIRER